MSATFRIDGTAAGAIKAVDMLNGALNKTAKEGEEVAKSSKKAQENLRRLAEQADPMKKLTRQTEELGRAVKAGELTQKEATITAERYGREYTESLRKIRAAVVSTADAQVDWFKKLDETIAHTNKVDAQLASVGKSSDKAFGSAALASLGSYAAGIFSLSQVVSMVGKAFTDVENRAQTATESAFGSLAAAGELQQLGPEAFKRGMATARKLRNEGVVDDLAQGVSIATNLENSGMTGAEIDEFVSSVAANRVVSAANMERTAGDIAKFRAAFGEDAGSVGEVLDKALVVSTIPGVQTGLSQTVNETLKFAGEFRTAGFSDEEALAAFAGSEAVSPSAAAAAEGLLSFGVQVNKRQLAKGDLFDTVANIESQIKGGKTAYDILGEQNAVKGFERLQRQRDFILSAQEKISNAGGTLDSVAGLLSTDPEMAALNAKARAEAQEQGSQPITKEALYDALRTEQRGLNGGGFWASLLDVPINDILQNEESSFATALANDAVGLQKLSPELRGQLEEYMRRTAEAAERSEQQTRSRISTRPE
jgi:hypothetical protein